MALKCCPSRLGASLHGYMIEILFSHLISSLDDSWIISYIPLRMWITFWCFESYIFHKWVYSTRKLLCFSGKIVNHMVCCWPHQKMILYMTHLIQLLHHKNLPEIATGEYSNNILSVFLIPFFSQCYILVYCHIILDGFTPNWCIFCSLYFSWHCYMICHVFVLCCASTCWGRGVIIFSVYLWAFSDFSKTRAYYMLCLWDYALIFIMNIF